MTYENIHLVSYEDGEQVRFFHTDTDGLCMKGRAGVQVLLKEAYQDFDLCKHGGMLHIVCQNQDGDLLYLKFEEGKWHKYTLLVSKAKGAYDKHFFLLPTGSCIQLFYTLRSAGKTLLVQQILGEGAQPTVVAVIRDCACPFYAVANASLDTSIYYQNEQGIFGCKQYKWSAKALGEFIPVFTMPCETPYIALDAYGRQHVCCVYENKILYKQRGLDGTFGKEAEIPCPAHSGAPLPYIRFEEEKIYIIWKQERGVLYVTSTNDAESFCAPVRLLSTGASPVLFTLHSVNGRIPALGYFLGGEIKFYNLAAPPKQPPRTASQPQQKRAAPSSNAVASDDIERIKKAVSALSQELSELKNKVELALSFLENNRTGS